jgi:hypothetical protein
MGKVGRSTADPAQSCRLLYKLHTVLTVHTVQTETVRGADSQRRRLPFAHTEILPLG